MSYTFRGGVGGGVQYADSPIGEIVRCVTPPGKRKPSVETSFYPHPPFIGVSPSTPAESSPTKIIPFSKAAEMFEVDGYDLWVTDAFSGGYRCIKPFEELCRVLFVRRCAREGEFELLDVQDDGSVEPTKMYVWYTQLAEFSQRVGCRVWYEAM